MIKIPEKVSTQERFIQIANEALLKFGKVSIPYLMRKCKCSRDEAKKIVQVLNYKRIIDFAKRMERDFSCFDNDS